eukprot:gene4243-3067_t
MSTAREVPETPRVGYLFPALLSRDVHRPPPLLVQANNSRLASEALFLVRRAAVPRSAAGGDATALPRDSAAVLLKGIADLEAELGNGAGETSLRVQRLQAAFERLVERYPLEASCEGLVQWWLRFPDLCGAAADPDGFTGHHLQLMDALRAAVQSWWGSAQQSPPAPATASLFAPALARRPAAGPQRAGAPPASTAEVAAVLQAMADVAQHCGSPQALRALCDAAMQVTTALPLHGLLPQGAQQAAQRRERALMVKCVTIVAEVLQRHAAYAQEFRNLVYARLFAARLVQLRDAYSRGGAEGWDQAHNVWGGEDHMVVTALKRFYEASGLDADARSPSAFQTDCSLSASFSTSLHLTQHLQYRASLPLSLSLYFLVLLLFHFFSIPCTVKKERELMSAMSPSTGNKKPVVILVVGMAGTGKTTLVHRMQHYAAEKGLRSYYINLDPAVSHVPYGVNIDIRDTVKYKEVMQSYRLGPNGAIMTCLNLFATKFHQVVELLESKTDLDWIIVDTPGQIEVFTWSASGQLISSALMAAFPTMVLFVADITRCASPQTFVSAMLYASGIMLKQQIPLAVMFNKTDVLSADMVVSWLRDSDALEEAVYRAQEGGEGAGGAAGTPYGVGATESYAGTLSQSLSLFLHEFYEDLPFAAVSAATGAGMDDLAAAVARGKTQAIEEGLRKEAQGLNETAQLSAARAERQAKRFEQDAPTLSFCTLTPSISNHSHVPILNLPLPDSSFPIFFFCCCCPEPFKCLNVYSIFGPILISLHHQVFFNDSLPSMAGRKFECKVFSNETLFTAAIPRCRGELAAARVMPLSAVILLNSPTVGPWELKEYTRLHGLYRQKACAAEDALPCYFMCADGAYSSLKKGWAAGEASWQEQMPDVVIGDMDSCDGTLLPPSLTEGQSTQTPHLHLYPTVAEIPLDVLTMIRERAVRAAQGQHGLAPLFIRIECQMTTDFQKVVHLLHRLEEAFPSDFPRFSRVVKGKSAGAFALHADPSVTADAFLQHFISIRGHLIDTIGQRTTGAWAGSVSAEVQEQERQRIISLLLEASGVSTPDNGMEITSHILPSIVTLGALGGRFDHEMAVMSCLVEHNSLYHIMVTNSHNVISACWTDGLTQWIPYNENTEPAVKVTSGVELLRELSAGCGVIPFGTVKEMETTGLLYNVVTGREDRCDGVTQTSGYRFAFGSLISACNNATEPLVTVDLRGLHGTVPDGVDDTYNPPTAFFCLPRQNSRIAPEPIRERELYCGRYPERKNRGYQHQPSLSYRGYTDETESWWIRLNVGSQWIIVLFLFPLFTLIHFVATADYSFLYTQHTHFILFLKNSKNSSSSYSMVLIQQNYYNGLHRSQRYIYIYIYIYICRTGADKQNRAKHTNINTTLLL